MGRHPLGSLRRIDRKRAAPHGPGADGPPRRQARPRAAGRAASRSPTSRSSRSPRRCRFDARVLIMDEPTAALSGHEVERLFGVVRTLRERGAAVLFISPPARRDLRDLRHGHRPARRRGHARRPHRRHGHRRARPPHGRPRARRAVPEARRRRSASRCSRSTRLTREGVFIDVSFEVRRGEIVALAGLVGAGRSEVARAIFGVDTPGRRRRRPSTASSSSRGSPTAAMKRRASASCPRTAASRAW